MLRLPNHMLEYVDVPRIAVPRPVRLPRLSADRLDKALAPTRRPTHVKGLTGVEWLPHTIGSPSLLANVVVGDRRVTRVPPLQAARRFPVASIDLSRRDVGLPYGVPRYVSATTLKGIAGGRRFDRLLKKTDSGWEFVPNDTRIDLMDGSQEFRLGRLTIFS